MRHSALVDRGQETAVVYPQKIITTSRGDEIRIPDHDNPVEIKVNCSTDRQSVAELPGQVQGKVLNLITRKAPVTVWAEVVFRGEHWDIAIPPTISHGTSRATRHWEFQLKSRNESTELDE